MLFILLSLTLSFQTPLKDQEAFRKPYTEGANALNANKIEEALKLLEQAHGLNAHHTGCAYALSIARAASGKKDEAFALLGELIDQGLVFRLDAQLIWKNFENEPRFQSIAAKMAENAKSKGRATVAFNLPERDLFPEGIAYDAKTERFFLSSIHQRKIVSIDKNGVVKDFISADRGLLWSAMGMQVDPAKRRLWVTSSAIDESKNVGGEKGRSALLCFDLDSGSLLEKILTPNQEGPSILGDLCFAPNGDLYLSDGGTGAVFLLKKDSKELEPFFAPGFLRSPQGMAFDPSGERLYVADYSHGLFVYEVKSGYFRRVRHGKEVNSLGADGLVWSDKGLVAIQNGINPQRVVRWSLDASGLGIAKQEILEANHPSFNEPTLGTIVGKNYFFVATSQWGNYDEKHHPLALEKLGPMLIMKIDL